MSIFIKPYLSTLMTRKGGVDLASCTAGCIGASDHACWMLSVTCLWHAVGFILSCCKQSAWVFLPHPGWQSYRELSLPLHFRPYKSQGFWLVRRSSCTHPLSQFMGLEWVIVASWAGHTFTLCWHGRVHGINSPLSRLWNIFWQKGDCSRKGEWRKACYRVKSMQSTTHSVPEVKICRSP